MYSRVNINVRVDFDTVELLLFTMKEVHDYSHSFTYAAELRMSIQFKKFSGAFSNSTCGLHSS